MRSKGELNTVALVALGLMFIVGVLTVNQFLLGNGPVQSNKFCVTAEDCVPAQCCHPDEAVNQRYAPDCSETFCTEECRAGTLDCNQGEIRCVENRCTVVINNPIGQQ